jgi:hypothetical protein
VNSGAKPRQPRPYSRGSEVRERLRATKNGPKSHRVWRAATVLIALVGRTGVDKLPFWFLYGFTENGL